MLTPADLFEVRKIVVATTLLGKGDFDAELARMEEAAQRSVETASAEATKIRDQANEYLDTIQTKSKTLMDEVAKSKDELAADRAKFEEDKAAAEVQADERYAKTREAQQELEATRVANEELLASLTPRIHEIERRESNLESSQARVDALAAELTEKLTNLRKIAA